MRRFVDISVPLQAGIASDPPGHLPEIDYYDHKQTAAEVVSFFPGAKIQDLPDGEVGHRTRPGHHPQRHPCRCALPLRVDDGRRQAGDHDR